MGIIQLSEVAGEDCGLRTVDCGLWGKGDCGLWAEDCGEGAEMGRLAKSFEDLEVYQRAFSAQQRVFDVSKRFPQEEKYSLTDQVRRASRSIGANIAESWQKRRYSAHFVSKLSDADSELAETLHWLATALACGYISADTLEELRGEYQAIGVSLGGMIKHADTWCSSQSAG